MISPFIRAVWFEGLDLVPVKSARCESQVENQYWRDLALARGRAGGAEQKKNRIGTTGTLIA